MDEALKSKFKKSFGEDEINKAHQIVVVASELNLSTERIVKYLNDYEIPINTMFFNVFRDGDSRYLSRAWLIDPAETREHANLPKDSDTEPWNGEYYVSFGHDMGRHWEDARKYGFISVGGGRWYSKTPNQLSKGDRVWVNIPKTGYVGIGIVEEPAVMARDFKVNTEQGALFFIPFFSVVVFIISNFWQPGYIIQRTTKNNIKEYRNKYNLTDCAVE